MAATGVPRARASSSTRESGSGHTDGKTRAVARARRAARPRARAQPAQDQREARGRGGVELQRVGERALAQHHQRQARARRRHRGHEQPGALVLLELADEEQEALGQRERGRRASAIARTSAASTTFGITSTRGMPAARSSAAMASLTARRRARAAQGARASSARSSPCTGWRAQASGPGAGTRPSTQRVMGPDAAFRAQGALADARRPEADRPVVAHGHRHPRRVGRRDSAPSADSECWACTTSRSDRRRARGQRRAARQAACARARSAGARAGRRGPPAPGLVVSTVTSWPASRSPRASARVDQPAPARARRIHLAGQDASSSRPLADHAAAAPLELRAVACPRVALDHALAGARAQPLAQRRVAGQPRDGRGQGRGIAFARRAAPPGPRGRSP